MGKEVKSSTFEYIILLMRDIKHQENCLEMVSTFHPFARHKITLQKSVTFSCIMLGERSWKHSHSQQPLINNLGINLTKEVEAFYNETFVWKPPFSGLALIVSEGAMQTAEGKKHSIITKPINHMTGPVVQTEIQKIQQLLLNSIILVMAGKVH